MSAASSGRSARSMRAELPALSSAALTAAISSVVGSATLYGLAVRGMFVFSIHPVWYTTSLNATNATTVGLWAHVSESAACYRCGRATATSTPPGPSGWRSPRSFGVRADEVPQPRWVGGAYVIIDLQRFRAMAPATPHRPRSPA